MRYLYIIILFLTIALIISTPLYAAYVGDPICIFTPNSKEKAVSIYADAIADIIYDRNAKQQNGDTEIDFYGVITGVVIKNRFALYGGIGAAKIIQEHMVNGVNIGWESDYGFTWLTGGALKLYEANLKDFYDSNLLFGADIQYRNTGLDASDVRIGSEEYSIPHSAITHTSMEYNDWHVAVSGALKIGTLSPYMGIKYSDFEACPRVTRNGIVYEKNNAEAADNFGIFIGMGINIIDFLSAQVEASFIDENSLSGSLSIKF